MRERPGLDDVVLIKRQPSMQIVPLEGEVGVITELQPNQLVEVVTLRATRGTSGCGSIPIDCLQLVDEALPAAEAGYWKERAQEYKREQEKALAASRARSQAWQNHAQKVAEKYGVSVMTALNIYAELQDFHKFD